MPTARGDSQQLSGDRIRPHELIATATGFLVLAFRKGDTALPCGPSLATLTGETIAGRLITSSAFVRVVGCPP